MRPPFQVLGLRWSSPAEMRAYERARREEAIGRPNLRRGRFARWRRDRCGSAPVGARARALVREQLANGPRPGAQIEAATEGTEIPERSLIAVANVLVRSAGSSGCRLNENLPWLYPIACWGTFRSPISS